MSGVGLRYTKEIQYEFHWEGPCSVIHDGVEVHSTWEFATTEILVAVAVKEQVDGLVYQGLPMEIHANVSERNGWDWFHSDHITAGWITNHGRFLDRTESFDLGNCSSYDGKNLESCQWRMTAGQEVHAFTTL
jgi:hypothetical protein